MRSHRLTQSERPVSLVSVVFYWGPASGCFMPTRASSCLPTNSAAISAGRITASPWAVGLGGGLLPNQSSSWLGEATGGLNVMSGWGPVTLQIPVLQSPGVVRKEVQWR